MRIGHSTVRTAGFNLDYRSDSTADEVMGQLTTETVDAARQAGYGLAVSVGLTDELRAAGFVTAWPHLMWFVPADALPANEPHASTEFDPVHRDDLAALYDAEHAGLTGVAVRPTYLANKEPQGFRGRLWSDGTGAASGYVSYAVIDSWTNRTMLGPSHRGYDQLLWHDESAGDPDVRLSILGELAREHGCHEIAFDRLHPRSPLADRIRELPHRVEHGYRHSQRARTPCHHRRPAARQAARRHLNDRPRVQRQRRHRRRRQHTRSGALPRPGPPNGQPIPMTQAAHAFHHSQDPWRAEQHARIGSARAQNRREIASVVPRHVCRHLVNQLEHLGYQVELHPAA
jgi:hypothetical protein